MNSIDPDSVRSARREICDSQEQLEYAMDSLRHIFADTFNDVPSEVRTCVDNALLNVAVNRLIDVEGEQKTAAMLWRLADALTAGTAGVDGVPVSLDRLNS